jgi:hypothetical protein
MPPIESINCPRCFYLATKRWLPPEEREMLTEVDGDVFEIVCQQCGSFEAALPELEALPRPDQ